MWRARNGGANRKGAVAGRSLALYCRIIGLAVLALAIAAVPAMAGYGYPALFGAR